MPRFIIFLMIIMAGCAAAKPPLYLFLRNGKVFKVDVEAGAIVDSTKSVDISDFKGAYVYDIAGGAFFIKRDAIFIPGRAYNEILHNKKYGMIYLISGGFGTVLGIMDSGTLEIKEKKVPVVESVCLQLADTSIFAEFWPSGGGYFPAETSYIGFGGVFLSPDDEIIYVCPDYYKLAAFRCADFSLLAVHNDSNYRAGTPPIFGKGGTVFYTDGRYD